MIGFSLQVKIYDEDGETRHATALVSLDIDDPDEPTLDLRIVGDDTIVTTDIEDAYRVIDAVRDQLWERKRAQDTSAA